MAKRRTARRPTRRAKRARSKASSATLVTRRQLAAARAVHMQTITKWEREGMPIAQRGRRGKASLYAVAEVDAWVKAREAAAAAPGPAVDLIRERAEKERWQGHLARQSFLAKERELLPASEVQIRWSAEVAACRAIILNSYATATDRVFRAATLEGIAGVERELLTIAHAALRELSDPDRPVGPAVPPPETPTDEGHAA